MPRPKDHDARERLQHHAFFFPGGGRELFIDYCNKVNSGILSKMKGKESQFFELEEFDFNVSNVQVDTEKYSKLIDSDFSGFISQKPLATRQLFGYGDHVRRDQLLGPFFYDDSRKVPSLWSPQFFRFGN